jgi:hypothetical protein
MNVQSWEHQPSTPQSQQIPNQQNASPTQKSDESTKSLTTRDDDDMMSGSGCEDDSLLLNCDGSGESPRNKSVEVVYENWEILNSQRRRNDEDDDDDDDDYDDDDYDGVPL